MSELKKARTNPAKYKYMLEFPSTFRIYTDDKRFLSKVLVEAHTSESKPQKVLIDTLPVKWHKKNIVYQIFQAGEHYEIISSESKDPTHGAVISKEIVDRIDSYLRKERKKRSAYNIQRTLRVSLATVLNGLKVLRAQKKVKREPSRKHRRQQFRAC
jgi:hypothetical protein